MCLWVLGFWEAFGFLVLSSVLGILSVFWVSGVGLGVLRCVFGFLMLGLGYLGLV